MHLGNTQIQNMNARVHVYKLIEPADAEGIVVEPAERHSQEAAKLMQPAVEIGGPNHWIVALGKVLFSA